MPKNSVQETLRNLQSEVESAISEAEDVSDSVKSTLSDAFDTYKAALDAIPSDGDTTLAEAADEVVSASGEFRSTWDSTIAELNCDTPTTTAAG